MVGMGLGEDSERVFPEVLGLPSQVAALKAEIRTLKAEIARLQQLLSLSGDGGQADVSPQTTPAAGSPQLVAEVPRILGMEGGQKGGVRASGVVEQSLVQGVQLAKQLAKANAQLRVAFDRCALARCATARGGHLRSHTSTTQTPHR